MAFELQVVSHAPLTGEPDSRRLAKILFSQIGYTARKGPDHGISFRLFYDCFLMHPTKEWTVEELAHACGTTMPSIYRHLNKLKDYDIVEDVFVGGEASEDGEGSDRKRAFRLRYGDFGKAWNFVEAHFHLAIENYRKSVDHLEDLMKAERRTEAATRGADPRTALALAAAEALAPPAGPAVPGGTQASSPKGAKVVEL